MEMLIIYLFI